MKTFIFIIITYLASLSFKAQTYNNYYHAVYKNLGSNYILTTPDSGCVFVNYREDSVTGSFDANLLQLDKNGNLGLNKTFNRFNKSYTNDYYLRKSLIPATASTYLMCDEIRNLYLKYEGIIISKINRQTLDTIKTNVVVKGNSQHGFFVKSFIKLNENKYVLLGNRGKLHATSLFMAVLDSNLQVKDSFFVHNTVDLLLDDAVYNPSSKQFLLLGRIAKLPPNLPSTSTNITLMRLDTLGNVVNPLAIIQKQSNLSMGLDKITYCALDSTYLITSGMETNSSLPSIAKFNATTLLPIWQKTYGENSAYGCITQLLNLPDGSIVGCGNYGDSLKTNIDNKSVILKTDKDGNLQWFRQYNQITATSFTAWIRESFYDMDRTREGGFVLCGNSISVKPKDKTWAIKTDSLGCVLPGCANTTLTVNDVNNTTYTFNISLPPPTVTTSIKTLGNISATFFVTYPNPTSEIINYKLEIIDEDSELSITDIYSREVKRVKLTNDNQINVSELNAGIYFLQVYENGKLLGTQKIIKN